MDISGEVHSSYINLIIVLQLEQFIFLLIHIMHIPSGFPVITAMALTPVLMRTPTELFEMFICLAQEALFSIGWTFPWGMRRSTVPALGLTPTVAMLSLTSALLVTWAFEALLLGYCINLSCLLFVNILQKILAQFLSLYGTLYSLSYYKTLGWGIGSFHPVQQGISDPNILMLGEEEELHKLIRVGETAFFCNFLQLPHEVTLVLT